MKLMAFALALLLMPSAFAAPLNKLTESEKSLIKDIGEALKQQEEE